MKNHKAEDCPEKPVVETDRYRIWAGEEISAKKRKKMEQLTLQVHPGERIHKIVVMELIEGHAIKVLSKVRDKDGKINVLVKFEKPENKCSVLRLHEWITENSYNRMLDTLKKGLGVVNIMTTSGEEVHAGIAYSFSKKDSPTRTEVLNKKRVDRDVA
jgi:hypothetical protein